MQLSVEVIRRVDQLTTEDLTKWNALASNPLQRWEWLGSWWDAYQDHYELYILSIKRDGEVIAFAPWCLHQRMTTGRTVQFLGSGKACTDHLSILVDPENTEPVCEAIACWLGGTGEGIDPQPTAPVSSPMDWDSIELIGVDQDDAVVNCLVRQMKHFGLDVDQSEGMGCYVIDLPETWEDYVQMRSKSGRREIRQSLKNVDNGQIAVKRIENETELDAFWEQFVMLHQKRRHASGTTGCFDHPPFGTFLRTAASRLLQSGLLEFSVASSDGVPVSAQFAIADDEGWYFYQSGMEPNASDLRPGLSTFCNAIRSSIQSGRKRFDMMRGDEPYKLRWRAELVKAQEVRVCSPKTSAQVRRQVYQAGLGFKNLLKSGLGIGQTQG